ncbi:MAG TPA: hypothetical protein VHO49_13555 [Anaerolineales bacterium]|nr:hypothetical protein [Anaerolineales bacterium]
MAACTSRQIVIWLTRTRSPLKRFADYKEPVIDLLTRVCTVSVETMRIVKEMP